MKLNLAIAATAIVTAAALTMSSAANATTYTSTRDVGGAAVAFSVTTDGVIGSVATSDITSWNIDIVDGAGSVDLTPLNSQVLVTGDLSATATALSFNFSGTGLALFEETTIGDSGPFYCATNEFCYGESQPSEGVSTQYGESPIEQTAQTGEVVLGSAGGVPEPTTWAMMLVGFGGLGVAMRSRRKQVAAAA